jgi:hypothetical protein
MRTRCIVLSVLVTAAVLWGGVGPASAKGPQEATIDGEGLATPIRLTLEDEQLMELADASAFWTVVGSTFPVDPEITEPARDLGPELSITWTLPTANDEVQEHLVYPWAEGGSVAFVPAGQPTMSYDETRGSWHSVPGIEAVLADLGVTEASIRSARIDPSVKVLDDGGDQGLLVPIESGAGLTSLGAIVLLGGGALVTGLLRRNRRGASVAPA